MVTLLDRMAEKSGMTLPVKLGGCYIKDSKDTIYSHINSSSYMLRLAKSNRVPVSSVLYCPDPCIVQSSLIHSVLERSSTLLLVVIGRCDRTSINRVVAHVKSKYKSIKVIEYTSSDDTTLTNVYKYSLSSTYVIVVNADRLTAGIVLGSASSCCFINPNYGDYAKVVPKDVAFTASTYEELKVGFRNVYIKKNNLSSISSLMRWSDIILGYEPPIADNGTVKPSGIRYCIDQEDYYDSSTREYYMSKHQQVSCVEAPVFDPTIIKSFRDMECVRPYLWFGCIESLVCDDVRHLFNLNNFVYSTLTCKGIFVYSKEVYNYLSSAIKVPVELISPALLSMGDNKFNYSTFCRNPEAVYLDTDQLRVVTINISTPVSTDTRTYANVESTLDCYGEADSGDNVEETNYDEDLFGLEDYLRDDVRDYPSSDCEDFNVSRLDSEDTETPTEDFTVDSLVRDLAIDNYARGPLDGDDEEQILNNTSYNIYNKIIVLTGPIDCTVVGIITYAISTCTPVVVTPSRYVSKVLDANYPLVMDNIDDSTVSNITAAEIQQAQKSLEIIRTKYVGWDQHIRQINKSKTGQYIAKINNALS